jgi:serine/threonine protein kinase
VGGFATVWLYHDAELRSDVAVKALAENWAQRIDVRERFLEEARILRQADSDHIVRVYDIGEADGTPYFVMTYADLGSLADVLERERRLPVPTALDLVRQAGAGLSVLHEQGVIHRDIKPQNLLLRSGGSAGPRLLVADLGVAKAMLHASGLTQVVGTPAYMAPEQATGIGIDLRADVHALGAVTYQMLTGALARNGSIGELLHATLPPPPSSLADLPSAVDDVLLRALEPDPEDRWPDVASYVAALRAALPSQVPGVEDQLTLWHVPDRTAADGAAPAQPVAGPLWPTVLISLLAFVAAFALAYVLFTALR